LFANASARYLNTHNFDGINMNIESGITTTAAQTEQFYRILRRALGSKLITAAPILTAESNYNTNCISYMDFILPQFYNYHDNWDPNCNQNSPFLSAPLHAVGTTLPAGSNHHAIGDMELNNWGPTQWNTSGWPKSKIVIFVTTNAMKFTNVNTMFGCGEVWGNFLHDSLALTMKSYGGTETWDPVHIGSYIAGTATSGNPMGLSAGTKFYIPFMSQRNMDSIVAWGRAHGYKNFGLYDAVMDCRPTKIPAMHVHNMLTNSLNGTAPVVLPSFSIIPSIQSFGSVTINTTSGEQKETIVGSNLSPTSGNISVIASTNFEVSTVSGAGFASSVAIPYSNGTLALDTIFVHFKPTLVQNYSGGITFAGGGVAAQNVIVNGVGLATPGCDTVKIPVPYAVVDSISYPVYVHDTTIVKIPYPVHDTTIVKVPVPYPVHDTTIVYDTIPKPFPYPVHDTTIVYDTVKVWDNVSYLYVASTVFPDSAVVLPVGAIILTQSHNATTKKTTLTFLKPKQ
jgi:hypothetical protein